MHQTRSQNAATYTGDVAELLHKKKNQKNIDSEEEAEEESRGAEEAEEECGGAKEAEECGGAEEAEEEWWC